MTIQYSIEDLRACSSRLQNEYSSMSDALNNLNTTINSIKTHWTGTDATTYITQFSNKTLELKNYLSKLQAMATNLNAAADAYEQHEEQFSTGF